MLSRITIETGLITGILSPGKRLNDANTLSYDVICSFIAPYFASGLYIFI